MTTLSPLRGDHTGSCVFIRWNVQGEIVFPLFPSCIRAGFSLHAKLLCLVHSLVFVPFLLKHRFPAFSLKFSIPFTHGEMSLNPSLKS